MSKSIPNFQILNAKETLEALLSQKKDAPVKLAYAAKKTHSEVSEEAEQLEEFRMDLLKDFAETDEEGNVKQQTDDEGEPLGRAKFESDEAMQEFQERLNEIYSDESSVDVHTVDIGDVGEYEVPADWANNIDFMIEGFETESKELKGGEIQASIDSIETILGINEEEMSRLQLKFASALFRNYEALADIQQDIEKSRMELLSEYAETDEEGNVKTREDAPRAKFKSEEDQESFQEELNEVYNEDFEFDASLVELDYTDGIEIHPRHTIILDWMLTDQ